MAPRRREALQPTGSTATKLWLASSFGFAGLLLLIITLANTGSSIVDWVRYLPGGDLMGHFLLMGTLSFLVTGCWPEAHWRLSRPGSSVRLLKAPTIVLVLVSLEELSQLWQPHRTFSVGDWLADLAGIVVFSVLAVRWLRYRDGAGAGAALPGS